MFKRKTLRVGQELELVDVDMAGAKILCTRSDNSEAVLFSFVVKATVRECPIHSWRSDEVTGMDGHHVNGRSILEDMKLTEHNEGGVGVQKPANNAALFGVTSGVVGDHQM